MYVVSHAGWFPVFAVMKFKFANLISPAGGAAAACAAGAAADAVAAVIRYSYCERTKKRSFAVTRPGFTVFPS